MSSQSRALLDRCVEASESGADFAGIWETILKPDEFVVGLPHQAAAGELEIQLLNGQRLIYQFDSREFHLG
jgi:hypothetical protein